jgi:streptogramin lyase
VEEAVNLSDFSIPALVICIQDAMQVTMFDADAADTVAKSFFDSFVNFSSSANPYSEVTDQQDKIISNHLGNGVCVSPDPSRQRITIYPHHIFITV